ITAQIEKRGGEIVTLKKWDERQLAYEIDGKTRGTYILVYFNCEPASIASIERDNNLSEDIMRAMILRADFIASPEQMDKKAPTITDLKHRVSDEGWRRDDDVAPIGIDEADDIDDVEDVVDDE
ncbi:30S ribosomal protein S6, partial [Candidatus Oleimmundimicrobium sp.]|uniref:30S ribosomal protein S6 n=1 Tax=Candidatus Oleimmundimicrobium sp. TaxID=3060597 RepID=UPI00271DBBD9